MANFHNLEVYQLSVELARDCIASLARRRLPGDLKNQIERASVSIAANIAEGSGRQSNKELIRFCRIARGSANEVETLLAIIGNQPDLLKRANRIARMLSGLIRSLTPKPG